MIMHGNISTATDIVLKGSANVGHQSAFQGHAWCH